MAHEYACLLVVLALLAVVADARRLLALLALLARRLVLAVLALAQALEVLARRLLALPLAEARALVARRLRLALVVLALAQALEVLARRLLALPLAVAVVAVEVAAPLEGCLPKAQAWPSPLPLSSLSSSSGRPSQRVSVSGSACTRRIAVVFSFLDGLPNLWKFVLIFSVEVLEHCLDHRVIKR